MRNVGTCEDRRDCPGRRLRPCFGTCHSVDARQIAQEVCGGMQRAGGRAVAPDGVVAQSRMGLLRVGFPRRDHPDEIAQTDDNGAAVPNHGFVQRLQAGSLSRAPHDAAVQHAFEHKVVDEGRTSQLCRQIEARHVAADHTMRGDRMPRDGAGHVAGKIDSRRERPVIMPGGNAVAQDASILDGKCHGEQPSVVAAWCRNNDRISAHTRPTDNPLTSIDRLPTVYARRASHRCRRRRPAGATPRRRVLPPPPGPAP